MTGPGLTPDAAEPARQLIGPGKLWRRIGWWAHEVITLCAWLTFLGTLYGGAMELMARKQYHLVPFAIAGVLATLIVGADLAARWRRYHDRLPSIAELERGEVDADFE